MRIEHFRQGAVGFGNLATAGYYLLMVAILLLPVSQPLGNQVAGYAWNLIRFGLCGAFICIVPLVSDLLYGLLRNQTRINLVMA